VTITGAPNSLSRAIDVAQTVSGSAGSSQQFNQFLFTDVANLGAFTGNGLNVQLNYGGGASQGNRQAIQAGVTLTSATNASNSAHFYVAGQFNAQANTADNGTNTGAGAKGAVIGINPACTLGASATNIAECAGIEITVQTLSGSSLSERSGLQISDISGAGGSQGATFDSAISMGNTASSPGWKSGIAFDATNYGSAPLDSTNGRAIEVIGSQTMKDFIYATNLTISGGNFITGPGSAFVVSGTGSGIGSTPSDSVILQNTSAASAGAQQFSPRLRFTGHGWRTNGGGASETVDWTIDNRPVQSTADPWTNLSFNVQLNAGGYTPHTTFIYGPSTNAPAAPSDANQRFMVQRNVNGESLYGVDAGGGVYAWCVTCTSTIFGTQVAVALDFFTNNVKRMEFAPTSTHLVFLQPATPALSSCGTSPTITSASTDIAGTVTTGTGTPAGCTITFNVAYISAPTCVVTWRGNLAAMGYATSTTAITLTQTAHDSSVIDYSCYGV
jgi:hypothetical protein